MIKKVRLKNWKSHLDSEFEFSGGTNVIVGIMGSGKSSILDAISFAFFGTFPTLNSKKISLDDVIMKRPVKAEEAEVELVFEADKNTYSVLRKLGRGKGTVHAEIRKGGALLEVNPESVTALVEDILQVDYQLFSRAVYSEQNNLDHFLSIPKGRRMEHIDRMLKVDEFEAVRAAAQKIRNSFSERAVEKAKIISELEKEGLADKMHGMEEEVRRLSGKMVLSESRIRQLSAEKGLLEEEIEKIELKKDELSDLKIYLESVRSAIAEISSREAEIRAKISGVQKTGVCDSILNLEEKIRRGKDNVHSIDSELSSLKAELMSASSMIWNLEKREIPDLAAAASEAEKDLLFCKKLGETFGPDPETFIETERSKASAIKDETMMMEARLSEVRNALSQLHGSEKCPVCDSNLSGGKAESLSARKHEEAALLEKAVLEKKSWLEKSNISRLEADYNKLKILQERAKASGGLARRLGERVNEAATLKQKAGEIEPKISRLSGLREMAADEITGLEESLQKNRALVEKFDELEAAVEKKQAYLQKLASIEKKVVEAQNAVDFERLASATEKLKQAISATASEKSNLEHCLSLIGLSRGSMADIGRRLKVLESYKAEAESSKNLIAWLDGFGKAVAETQDELRISFLYTVNNIMGRVWKKVYPYEDIGGIRLLMDGDYVLQLKMGDDWITADGIASGGERSIACLVLRIAFSMAFIPNLKWLMLDEPTHNLDAAAIQCFSSVLGNGIGQIVNQIFLITHESRMAESVEGILYTLERDKTGQRETVVRAAYPG